MKIQVLFKMMPFLMAAMVCLQTAQAQETNSKKFTLSGDATFRAATGQFGGGLSVWGHWGLGKAKKFQIGLGLRHSTHIGSHLEYTTAPAKFTSDESKIDTLEISNSTVTSLSLALDFRYRLASKFSLGFNIDALGFSFGPEQKGHISAGAQHFMPKAKPTSLNALLVGDNDIGSLNSELYVLYHASNRLSVKAAFSYLFTEYTTDKKYIIGIDNDRFRNNSMGGAIGIQYAF